MTTFRKRPITVEAYQVFPEDPGGFIKFCNEHEISYIHSGSGPRVRTVDGNDVLIPWGAYIVIDSKGFPYPCDAEVFENGHDTVEGSEAPSGERVDVPPMPYNQD